ncbi:calcium-dependent protein kinase SK5-like protein [Tanacetum coccineum]
MQFEEIAASSVNLYPFCIPDLYGSPLVVSGRYNGKFPDIVEAIGIMADMSTRVIDVKVRNAKSIPLDMETLAPALEYSGIEVIRRFHKGDYLDVKTKFHDDPSFLSYTFFCATLNALFPHRNISSIVINAEYRISGTHVNPLGLKSDALIDVIWDIMQYVGKLYTWSSQMPLIGDLLHSWYQDCIKFGENAPDKSRQMIAETLSEEEIGGLKELFKMIDTNNSGTIYFEQPKEGLRRVGSELMDYEIKDLMDAKDSMDFSLPLKCLSILLFYNGKSELQYDTKIP